MTGSAPARTVLRVKRLATFLLLFCVTLGLAAQQPAQAFPPPIGQMNMAAMAQIDMSAMPDCMASMAKDATHKPCKCGLAGCLAMMASGATMMLAAGSAPPTVLIARDRLDHATTVPRLRGRSTAPEPKPPSLRT